MGRPGETQVLRRALFVALLGWLPIVVIVAVQPLFFPAAGLSALASDFAIHCRSLLAAPIFVLAEASCVPRLTAMARHFGNAGLVPEHERARYESAWASTRRWRDAPLAEAVVVVLAYGVVVALIYSGVEAAEWHRSAGGELGRHSPAGWWNALVSLPLLLALFFGWMWRLFLWARFLWLMSRLDLSLIAAHPDMAAGLMFVSYSIRAFAPVALAMSVVLAGTAANGVLLQGKSPFVYQPAAIALLVLVTLAFCSPVLVFGGKLRQASRDGILRYGAIARGLGQQFERKWLNGKPITESALQVPDFSEVTDLYQVAGNVYQMKLFPIEARSVALLIAMTALPLLLVLLLSLPADVILQTFANLLF